MTKHVRRTWQSAWPWVLLFRVCNAWFVATYFDPDEFWQAPESAHAWLHPGTTQLPWEHRARLRSAFHPMLLVAFAKLWPKRIPVMTSARMLHAGIACVADLAAVDLAEKHAGRSAARWTLVLQLSNWFLCYAGTRCFANGIETAFLTLSLAMWPERKMGTILCAAIACVVRPSAAAACAIASLLVWRAMPWIRAIGMAATTATVVLALDTRYYGELTFTPWNFFVFNILQGGADYYGVHPWHWYLTNAMPTMIGLLVVVIGMGFWKGPRWSLPLAATFIWLFPLSTAKHKEFRFALPAVPLLHVHCAMVITSHMSRGNKSHSFASPHGCHTASNRMSSKGRVDSSKGEGKLLTKKLRTVLQRVGIAGLPNVFYRLTADPSQAWTNLGMHLMQKNVSLVVVAHLLLQMPLSVYFCRYHQRGAVEAMRWLRTHADASGYPISSDAAAHHMEANVPGLHFNPPSDGGSTRHSHWSSFSKRSASDGLPAFGVMVLARCHATPAQSFTILQTNIAHLDCTPPSYRQNAPPSIASAQMSYCKEVLGNVSESDCFEWNPKSFAAEALARHPVDFLVIFDSARNALESTLKFHHCRQRAQFFQSHFSSDGSLEKYVWVYQCGGRRKPAELQIDGQR